MNNIEVALRLNMGNFAAGLGAAGAQVKAFGSNVQGSFRQAGSEISNFGKNAAAATSKPKVSIDALGKGAMVMGAGMLAGFGLAAKATMDFDRQLSELAAVTQASGADMDRLRQQALDMGRDTAFSASEAAQAQTELAKAGVSTADILGGALSGALSLAGAGSLDLASAAEIAAGAMMQFNLAGEDVGHIADVLANGANKSSADVAGLAQSMNQTGLVASQMGLSLEDTVGTLSAFAQAGMQGSDAGTSLKTALQRMIPQSVEAATTMERLGINFFDAQGNFVGITEAAEILQTQMAGLSQEQRAAAMQTIFGADAIRAATILYREGGEGIQEWVDGVDQSGTAALMAQAKMDNLAGDLEQLKGSLETALIGSGSEATGVLRGLTQGATDAVNAFSGLPDSVQGGVIAFAGLGGAALTVVGALGTLYPKLSAGRDAMRSMGTAGASLADNMGRIGMATAGVVALATATGHLADAIDPIEKADLSALENDLLDLADNGRLAGEAADVVGDDFDKLGAAFERVVAPSVGSQIETVTNEITTLGGLLGRGVADDLDEARQTIDDIDKAIAQLAARDPSAAAAAFERIRDALMDQGFSSDEVTSQFDDYGRALNELDTASRTSADGQGELAGAMGEAAGAAEDAESALRSYMDAQRAQMDPLFAALDAYNGVRDARVAAEDATRGVAEAEAALADAISGHGAGSAEAAAAQRDLSAAQRELEDSAIGSAQAALNFDSALLGLQDAVDSGAVSYDSAIAMLQTWQREGRLTQGELDQLSEQFLITAEGADTLSGRRVPVHIEAEGGPATRAELHSVRDTAQATGEQRPTVQVGQAGAEGTRSWLDLVTQRAQVAGSQRPRVGVSQSGAEGTRSWLDLVTQRAQVTGAQRPRVGVSQSGAEGTRSWLDIVTQRAQVTGSQRPRVGVSESGSASTRGTLDTVTAAANRIPGSRSTTVNATDYASATIRRVMDLLASADGRSANTTITTTHRQVFITEQRSGQTTGGAQLRWGGIVHARRGYNWDAKIGMAPTVHWGERETGGEAYVPRRGNRSRSLGILDVAAGWYGMDLVPQLKAATGLLTGVVRLGDVSPERWAQLRAAGWKGRAGDGMEALYPPSSHGRRAPARSMIESARAGFRGSYGSGGVAIDARSYVTVHAGTMADKAQIAALVGAQVDSANSKLVRRLAQGINARTAAR